MASDEGAHAGGSGAGRDKKRAAGNPPDSASAQPGSNGGSAAAPNTPPATASAAASQSAPQAAPAQAKSADSEDLVVVTLKASTGSIVSVEMAAPDGSHRHALTDSETARLVGERPTFATLVHDAFEAGIACVLDDRSGAADERSGETEEDADLHDALLDALIEHSAAKRLLSRETLHSAVLGTIIDAASAGAKATQPPAA
jgi:hypothetical protein